MRPHLFITGASGLVGRRIVAALIRNDPERSVTALVRRPVMIDGASTIAGDLTDAELELPVALLESVTEIMHCAADVRFLLPLEDARRINVEGTRRMLDAARACPRLTKLAHISTTYVIGRDQGTLAESPSRNVAGFLNTYQQSKHEAEQLVVAAFKDLPAAVFRLSSIAGNRDGSVDQFNYLHQLLRLVPRNPLPLLPLNPEARIDLIAGDWAAETLATLFTRHFEPGSVYHVCAGPQRSALASELVCAAFRRAEVPVPRFVNLEEFEAFAASSRDGVVLPLTSVLAHLALAQNFHAGRLAAADIDCPPSHAIFDGVLSRLAVPGAQPQR